MVAGLGLVGLIFALLLKRADRREGAGLEVPQNAEDWIRQGPLEVAFSFRLVRTFGFRHPKDAHR